MREKYLLELGGENTALGKYEALELFKFRKYHPKLENDYGKIVVISTSNEIENKMIAATLSSSRVIAPTKSFSRCVLLMFGECAREFCILFPSCARACTSSARVFSY